MLPNSVHYRMTMNDGVEMGKSQIGFAEGAAMVVSIAFEVDGEELAKLRKAAANDSHDNPVFVNAVHKFMEGDGFFDAVFHALAAAVGLKWLEGR